MLREQLVALARGKPRFGYRRLPSSYGVMEDVSITKGYSVCIVLLGFASDVSGGNECLNATWFWVVECTPQNSSLAHGIHQQRHTLRRPIQLRMNLQGIGRKPHRHQRVGIALRQNRLKGQAPSIASGTVARPRLRGRAAN